MKPANTVTGSVRKKAAKKIAARIPSFYNIPMKYSLRSLMIVAGISPPLFAVATWQFGAMNAAVLTVIVALVGLHVLALFAV
jgi:hypothetical protein